MFSSRAITRAALVLSGVVRWSTGFVVPTGSLARFSSSFGKRAPFLAEHPKSRLVQFNNLKARKAQGVRGLCATIPSDLKGRERLEKFIGDCVLLGPIRFVCMTDGAILEAVGSFENLRYSDLDKGRYATFSEGSGFECHLNTDKVKTINMLSKRSPAGDYDLYITRFLDKKGETMLSAMLHGVAGSYEPGAAAYWEKLRTTFGAEQTVA